MQYSKCDVLNYLDMCEKFCGETSLSELLPYFFNIKNKSIAELKNMGDEDVKSEPDIVHFGDYITIFGVYFSYRYSKHEMYYILNTEAGKCMFYDGSTFLGETSELLKNKELTLENLASFKYQDFETVKDLKFFFIDVIYGVDQKFLFKAFSEYFPLEQLKLRKKSSKVIIKYKDTYDEMCETELSHRHLVAFSSVDLRYVGDKIQYPNICNQKVMTYFNEMLISGANCLESPPVMTLNEISMLYSVIKYFGLEIDDGKEDYRKFREIKSASAEEIGSFFELLKY